MSTEAISGTADGGAIMPDDRAIKPEMDRTLGTIFAVCVAEIVLAAVVLAATGRFGHIRLGLASTDLMLGLSGSLPLFLVIYSSGRFNDWVSQHLGPWLSRQSVGTLVVTGGALAIAEETLFRGALPIALAGLGPIWAVVVANALFGACYSVNKGAAITMFLFGCYLSALNSSGDSDSLWRSTIAHCIFLAIILPAIGNAHRSPSSDAT